MDVSCFFILMGAPATRRGACEPDQDGVACWPLLHGACDPENSDLAAWRRKTLLGVVRMHLAYWTGAQPASAPVSCTPGRLPAAFIAHYLTVSTMLHVGRSQAGRALPGVRKPASSVRGTCIVVPQAALLAVPDAPPRFFAHRARSAPVPLAARACSPGLLT